MSCSHDFNHLPHNHGNTNIDPLFTSLPSIQDCSKMADTFKLLSDGSRLRILSLLCHREECVQNIAYAVDMSAPAISHHLKFLKQSGLIMSRRVGKEVWYKLSDTKEALLVHQMIDDIFKIKCSNES